MAELSLIRDFRGSYHDATPSLDEDKVISDFLSRITPAVEGGSEYLL